MKNLSFCTIGNTKALAYAGECLAMAGHNVTNEISDRTTHILLPIPSCNEDGIVHGAESYGELIDRVSPQIIIMGGRLPKGKFHTIDFLEDEYYLAKNAAITAHCAVSLAMEKSGCILTSIPILIIGWGRIGKCLTKLLNSMEASVTVAARKESDRAMIAALGAKSIDLAEIKLNEKQIVINTVPSPIIQLTQRHEGITLIDLASKKGIDGPGVLWARGLPNRMVPRSSGELIARTALRHAHRKE